MYSRAVDPSGKTIPVVPPKNPFQAFLLALSLGASLPLLRGETNSVMLESTLSDLAVILWGIALLVGSGIALTGMWMRNHRTAGLILERGGLILTGGAAATYTFAIMEAAGQASDVRYAAAIQVAYALACFWRVAQITRILRWAKEFLIALDDHLEERLVEGADTAAEHR